MPTPVSGKNQRVVFEDVSTQYNLAAADASDPILIAAKTGFTIYVQAILVNVTTDNAATLTFRDTGASLTIHATPASPGLGPFDTSVDFGDEGVALPVDTGLQMVTSAAGLAAVVLVYAYRRKTTVDKP